MLGPLFGFTDDDLVRLRALQRKTSLYGAVLAAVQSEEDNEFTRKARAFYARLTERAGWPGGVRWSSCWRRSLPPPAIWRQLGVMENGTRRREDARRFAAFCASVGGSGHLGAGARH